MSQTRIYVPLSIAGLRALAATGEVGPAPVAAHAVTDNVERNLPGSDEEEREYAAMGEAVDAATALREGPGHRRVVAAADVDSASVQARGGTSDVHSAVVVGEVVPLRRIVSFHVDEAGAPDEEDLLWYDVTELDVLLEEL